MRTGSLSVWSVALFLTGVLFCATVTAGAQESEKAPVAPTIAVGETTPAASDDSIVLNFEGVDIREVVFSLAAALKINYWIDPRVSGQVTVSTYDKISRDDLMPVFHQILRSNGYAAVKEGDLYMVVPAESGKTRALIPGVANDTGGFVMELVRAKHVSAEQIVTLISPFVSPGGDVVAYARSNLIVITDTAANAARLRELVGTFDSDTFGELSAKVYRIEHAALDEISQELWTVLESYQVVDTGARVHMIPLARLNALAVIAFDPVVFANIEYWLDILDVEAEGGARRQVYVYHVENSKAADLASVLNDLYAGEFQAKGERRARSGSLAEAGVGLGGGASTSRSRSASSRSGGQQRSGNTRPRPAANLSVPGGVKGGALFEYEIKIVPDEITNSLVILATPRDYNMIRDVLVELDVVPRQVLIEVLIAEITLDEDTQFGITQELLAVATDDSDSSATLQDAGGTFLDIFGRDVRFTGGAPSADSAFGGFMGVFTHYRSGAEVYRGVLKALAVRSRVKVLSRPHIMTADNHEATIIVGQEVPIITSQADTNVETSGQTRFLQNVQYRNTGVILKVQPQVNSEGLVNMKISQEVSDIIGTTTGNISSPTFSKRSADTTVIVQSGETIVIGGIIGETLRKGVRGVPFLMDVPVLGRLFRAESDEVDRTELVILITPYVVRNREEARSVTEEFQRKVDGVLHEFKERGRIIEEGHTVILEQSPS